MRESRTSGSVGAGGGRPPSATRPRPRRAQRRNLSSGRDKPGPYGLIVAARHLVGLRWILAVCLERVLPTQVGKPREVVVAGNERCVVGYRKGGQVGVSR